MGFAALYPSNVLLIPGQLLGLAIDHFTRDQLVFEMRVAVHETAPLLFPLFRRRLSGLGGFKELVEASVMGHWTTASNPFSTLLQHPYYDLSQNDISHENDHVLA
jgi:hypothetical protein